MMTKKTVLHIISSARGTDSYSRNLSTAIVLKLKSRYEVDTVIERDLTKELPPFFDEKLTSAFYQAPGTADEGMQQALKYADTILDDVRRADILVLGTPMYNLGMSAALKAWMDQLVRFGITYHYDENGIRKTNLNGKRIYLAIASGGKTTNGPDAYEFIASHIKAVFETYIGTAEMDTFRVEGTATPGFEANYEKILQDL